jgi:hypothetical protein
MQEVFQAAPSRGAKAKEQQKKQRVPDATKAIVRYDRKRNKAMPGPKYSPPKH